MKFKAIIITMFVFAIFYIKQQDAPAWENKLTHPAITQKAMERSIADDYLKTQLGLSKGLDTESLIVPSGFSLLTFIAVGRANCRFEYASVEKKFSYFGTKVTFVGVKLFVFISFLCGLIKQACRPIIE